MSYESGPLPQSEQLCSGCPRRSRIARAMAQILKLPNSSDHCLGPIIVSHGQVETYVWRSDSDVPQPDPVEWGSVMSHRNPDGVTLQYDGSITPEQHRALWQQAAVEERRYARTNWTEEVVCGRDELRPGPDEQPYSSYRQQPFIAADGRRVAAFINGDPHGIDQFRAVQAISGLLDQVPESDTETSV